jgi:hypothetical protein
MNRYLLLILILFIARPLFAFSLFTGMTPTLVKLESDTLVDLASTSYRAGDREKAKDYLNVLLKVNPADHYANHFLGALYAMDGNVEAALKYWNRNGEPRIEQIRMDPLPRVDAILMDRAFAIAPASPLMRNDYLETESRLRMMGIFKKYEFQLKPREDSQTFDLILKPQVRKGTLASKLKVATLVARGFFTETIEPEFHNIGGTTINSTSFLSWDEHRNRYYSSLSIPLGNDPHSRLRIFADHKSETWSLPSTLNLRKWEAGIEAGKTWNERLSWKSGTKASHRFFDGQEDEHSFFHEGWLVEAFGSLDFSLLRIPEKRLTVQSMTSAGTGKFLSGKQRPSFVHIENSLQLTWFPQPAGEDLLMTARAQFGRLIGQAPFDEYYSLGADRNMDLRLRAHRSRRDPYGENPYSNGYMLFNWDVSKTIIENGKLRWRLIPFADLAGIDGTELWNGPRWFLDLGMQSGFQVFNSVELTVTYGKDLRSGRNVIYFGATL